MAKVIKMKAGEEPPIYNNHVLVEQTNSSTFRASGASNNSGFSEYFAPPQTGDLAAIIKTATAWAVEKGIHFVYVKMQSSH